MMLLTAENYHSPEANRHYMSHSQYQDFLTCEAMAMAKIDGTWKQDSAPEQKVGSYVHAWNEGVLEQFKAQNRDIFKKDGSLLAQFSYADIMIETLQNDLTCSFMLEGEKEVIMTADFAGVPWKIKIDSYVPGQRIVDLKTAASLYKLYWSDFYKCKLSFIDYFNYPAQMALYCEIERLTTNSDHWLEPYLVVVTKETPPDKDVFSIDSDRMEIELANIAADMPHILAVKRGEVEPVRCGVCSYCRATKIVTGPRSYQELDQRKEAV
jgi:hypothetical protein